MNFSINLGTLLIIIFAVLPGIVGDNLYRIIVGSDWRESNWNRIFRIIGFSLVGMIFYILLGVYLLGFPIPSYIIPETYNTTTFDEGAIIDTAFALLGHIVFSTLLAMCIGVIVRAYNKFSPISSYPNTWDEFARECTQTRWIVVSLKNGDAYAGYLHIANTSVNASERDLILTEPAKFNKDNNSYVAQDYQYIFFPADLIKSIGVVHDPDLDLRVSKVGEPLFLDEENSDEEAFNEKG